MRLYTYPTCITSKRARRFLEERGARFEEVDLKRGLTEPELGRLIGTRDHAEFFNPRHPIYKERQVRTAPPPRAEAIRILAAEPRAIRRPLLVKGQRIVFGFDPEEYAALAGP